MNWFQEGAVKIFCLQDTVMMKMQGFIKYTIFGKKRQEGTMRKAANCDAPRELILFRHLWRHSVRRRPTNRSHPAGRNVIILHQSFRVYFNVGTFDEENRNRRLMGQ